MWRRSWRAVNNARMMQTTPEYVDLEFKMRCFGVFCDKNRKKFCFHLQKQGLHDANWGALDRGPTPSQAQAEQEQEQEPWSKIGFTATATHRCGSVLETENFEGTGGKR